MSWGAYMPWWQRALTRALPFLFKRCPGGNLHGRWDQVCHCRCGVYADGWHGGIYHFPSDQEVVWYAAVTQAVTQEARRQAVELDAATGRTRRVLDSVRAYLDGRLTGVELRLVLDDLRRQLGIEPEPSPIEFQALNPADLPALNWDEEAIRRGMLESVGVPPAVYRGDPPAVTGNARGPTLPPGFPDTVAAAAADQKMRELLVQAAAETADLRKAERAGEKLSPGLLETRLGDGPLLPVTEPCAGPHDSDGRLGGRCLKCGWTAWELSQRPAPTAAADRPGKPGWVTLSGKPPDPAMADRGAPQPIDERTGMHGDYWVLSEEERQKGFVRPVRRSYKHVGVRPKGPTRELSAEETERYARYGYVRYEAYDERSGRFWTKEQLESGCGRETTMSRAIAETYAVNPKAYGATFCCHCACHRPVEEFVWAGTDERVGS